MLETRPDQAGEAACRHKARLLGELEDDIQRFDRESDKHQRLYGCGQMVIIALAGTTSVVAGLGLLLGSSADQGQP